MTLKSALLAACGVSAGAPPAETDPYFRNVSLLLNDTGTNGAQNNTFVDSSTNNFTITRNGTPTQGSFSPYGDLWSNYFPGSGSFIQASGSQNQNLLGNGDFTIEAWVFSSTSTFNQTIVTTTSLATGARGFGWNLRFEGGYNIRFYVGSGTSGSDNEFLLATSTGITINTWNHIAVVRNGATVYVYVNGVQKGSAAMPATYNLTGTVPCQIGQRGTSLPEPIIGNISNCRIVAGTALYTSTFTPSTTPLTAVSGTSLLTCQSNRFRDNSSNNFAITVTGTPSVQRFSPFDPAAEYSTSVIGGSGYFGGSQFLTAPSNAAFGFGTGDFTIETWAYFAGVSTQQNFIDLRSTAGSTAPILYITATGVVNYSVGGAALISSSSNAVAANTWNHIALTRSSGSSKIFVNGVQVGSTAADSTNFAATIAAIGGVFNNTNTMTGYLSNTRIVKGTAFYTTNFTPPTTPLTAITNTSLLLNCVNAGIYDNAMMNDLVTVGNAKISTAVKKYGTGSMAFDGTGDCLTTPDVGLFDFGTGDFTVEGWIYPTAFITDGNSIASGLGPNDGDWMMALRSSTQLSWGRNHLAWDVTTSGVTFSLNTWYHVAVTKSSGTLRIFVDGVQRDSVSNSQSYNIQTSLAVGARQLTRYVFGPGEYFNGYIDDLRITKGYARYTANFTPPTAPFPTR